MHTRTGLVGPKKENVKNDWFLNHFSLIVGSQLRVLIMVKNVVDSISTWGSGMCASRCAPSALPASLVFCFLHFSDSGVGSGVESGVGSGVGSDESDQMSDSGVRGSDRIR